jgi:PST family polysaccharide transporter
MKTAAALGALQPAVALLLIWIVVRGPDSVAWVPLARLIGAASVGALGWMFLGLPLPSARPWSTEWMREHGLGRLLAAGAVLMLANTAVLLYNSADQLILKAVQGNQAVGIYGGAYRIIQLPMAASYTVMASAIPFLVGAARTDAAAAARTVRRLTWVAAITGLAIAALVWALREPIVRLVYGEAYRDSARALGVLAFAVPLDFVISVKGGVYRGGTGAGNAFACFAAITNVVANLIRSPLRHDGCRLTTLATGATVAYALIMDTRRS